MRRLLLFILFSLPLIAVANKTHVYHLANGLKLIVRENHRAPVVLSSVWYKVGSSYEHSGITGVSHVLEHMMFKGTDKIGAGELNKMINERGGDQNAITSRDYTIYYQKLPAKDLSLSFMLESDRMQNLLLKESDFKKEIQVVMEERRLRLDDSPRSKTWERFRAAAFVNNPYHNPVIGWMTDLKNMNLSDLKKWYDQWYVPNNVVVVVVGDVQPDKVLELANHYFGVLRPRPVPALKPRTEAPNLGQRKVVVDLPAKLPWLVVGFNTPSLTGVKNKSEAYALEMIDGLLDSGDSSRLPRELIRQKQVAVSASVGYDLYTLHSGLFYLMGIPSKTHTVMELKQALLAELNKLKLVPVNAKELQRVKAQVIAQNIYRKDSLMQQASDIGSLEAVGLAWQVGDEFVANIEKVTPQQIQEAAKKYFNSKRMTVAVLMPAQVKRKEP